MARSHLWQRPIQASVSVRKVLRRLKLQKKKNPMKAVKKKKEFITSK